MCDLVEMKNFSGEAAVSRSELNNRTILSSDEQMLAHFGKRQRFRRNFSLISIVGLSCTLMITWEGVLILLQPFIFNGGPTGTFAAFFFVIFRVSMQVLVMAELASMIPLAGGQYNWVALLASPKWSNLLSYLTGWLTTIAWHASCIGENHLNASLIQALVELNYPHYVPQKWHVTLIFYAIVLLAVLITTLGAKIFPKFEALALILHILGFVAILITLVYLAPKNSPSQVFQVFINGGGFSSDSQSWLVGTVSVMFTFIGIDAASHMAEEIKNAATIIPRSMIASVVLNGALGFGMVVALLFCMGPIENILSSELSFPFVNVFASVTRSTGGATAMVALVHQTAILLIIAISGSIGLLATSSRMLWAFARENGVPGSHYIALVEPRTALPLNAIATSTIVNIVFAPIALGSSTAFNAFTGLTIAGFYSSFMVAASVMLYKRLTTPTSDILWGPFRLGRAGVPITVIALIYSFIGWLFSFWPPEAKVTLINFNWSFVVYWAALIFASLWWAFRARHYYTGPKMELDALR